MKHLTLGLLLAASVSHAQIISTIAGTGAGGYSGDGAAALTARFNQPSDVVMDATGNLYITDYSNYCIRKINTAGVVSTIAGTGAPGYSGDGGPATAARLNHPNGLAISGSNLYFADYSNHCVRRINAAGVISTIAGTGVAGFNGDGILATAAQLRYPSDVAVDGIGNIYIVDASNHRIRKIDNSGVISTIAGSGSVGFSGDGGAATAASINNPFAVVADELGNVYISDQINYRIRKVNAAGIINTIAGTGVPGYSGDGGSALLAQFNIPTQMALDPSGNLFIADRANFAIRKISAAGIISTVAGIGTAGATGDGGPATAAQLGEVPGLCLDAAGNIYIADFGNNKVRKVGGTCPNGITHNPVNDTVLAGANAKYWVTTSASAPVFQWQQNAGPGFTDLADAWPYSGVTTDTLTIHNASKYVDATRYRCVILNESSCTDTSAAAALVLRTDTHDTHTPGNLSQADISIYPNPVTDQLVISLPPSVSLFNVQLINEIGQVVFEDHRNKGFSVINMKPFPAGMYFARIQCGNNTFYKKVSKN